MKNWNRTAKIKAIILGILFLPNILAPPLAVPKINISQYLILPIFMSLAIPFIVKINSVIFKSKIELPSWNDNPLKMFSYPLRFFHFGAWFFMVIGTSAIIGTGLVHHKFQTFGLVSVLIGVGLILGIHLSVRWIKPKYNKG